MSLSKKLFCFLFLIGLAFNFSVYANELDDECKTFCIKNGGSDGQYLPPEPGSKCNDDYEQSEENEICCCKPKA